MTRAVDGTLVKIMSWYDNEWGFSHQMVRTALDVLGLNGNLLKSSKEPVAGHDDTGGDGAGGCRRSSRPG